MPRPYSNFFDWGDQPRQELGVMQEWVRGLPQTGLPTYSDIQTYFSDPPDCIGRNEDGGIVALEATEIVSEEARRLSARDKEVLAQWDARGLVTHLQERLAKKDRKQFNGGPYDEIIVVMFTDEFFLTPSFVAAALDGTTVGPFVQITGAYVLCSYAPEVDSYPVIPIRLAPATPPRS